MKTVSLVVISFALVGCDSDTNQNNIPTPNGDAGADKSVGDVRLDAPTTPARTLHTRRLFDAPNLSNLLEDPNFTMQSDAWFVFNGNERQFARRAFHFDSPDNRPIAGVIGGATESCLLGRLKWTGEPTTLSVWLSYDSGTAPPEPQALGLRVGNSPEWQSVPLVPQDETIETTSRTWRKFVGSTDDLFGWGFLEFCNEREETLWVGAPTVVESSVVNAVQIPGTNVSSPTGETLERAKRFESIRRESADQRQRKRATRNRTPRRVRSVE